MCWDHDSLPCEAGEGWGGGEMTTAPRQITPAERRFVLFVDRLIVFIAKHWLLLVILALLVFDGLPFLAPLLMHLSITEPADLIYRLYGLTCHQLSYRTFFFFGDQPVYPLDQLHALLPGTLDEGALSFYWRDFLGNPQLGYKMAWCERDAAIYSAMLLASILFGLVRRWLKPLDWRIYLLLITPMAIDGLTQLTGLRESDYILRVVTGILFGAGSIWLIYPYVEEAMRDARAQAESQYQRGKAHQAA